MRAFRVSVAVAFAVLILGSVGTASATTYNLPSQSNVKLYVETLVSNFSSLVNSNYKGYTEASLRASFPLYQTQSSSFEVLVVQTTSDSPGYVALVFSPLPYAGANDIVMDNNDTLRGIEINQNAFVLSNSTFTATDLHIILNGVEQVFVLVIGLRSSDITSNTVGNAINEAGNLFQYFAGKATIVRVTDNFGTTTTQTVSTPASPSTLDSALYWMGAVVITYAFVEILLRVWKHKNIATQLWKHLHGKTQNYIRNRRKKPR